MQGRDFGRQPDLLANPLDQQQRRDLADPGLDRFQADQLMVQLRENIADADLIELLAKVDRGRRQLVGQGGLNKITRLKHRALE